jgi:hypothetical protein
MFFEGKIAALEAMRPDIEAMSAAERSKFAELCRRWADLAQPLSPASKARPTGPISTTGVLLELSRGARSED